MYNTQNSHAYEKTAFSQATNIADPVKDVIDLSINLIQVLIELERESKMHIVLILIGSFLDLIQPKHAFYGTAKITETDPTILQVQVSEYSF